MKPDKPGFANRCPTCSADENVETAGKKGAEPQSNAAMNAERRKAIRDLLYRKDS